MGNVGRHESHTKVKRTRQVPLIRVNSRSRTHVIVIFGGESAEHDVSCVTAAHVLRALDPQKYDVTTVAISRTGEWMLAESAMAALARGRDALPEKLEATGRPSSLGDVMANAAARNMSSTSGHNVSSASANTVVLPLLHGPMGEDGTVQGLLDLAHVAYVGAGVLGSAVSMDKATTKRVLAAENIPQPKFVALREDAITGAAGSTNISDAVTKLGLPVFVKPANMGSSVGVAKAKSAEEAIAAARAALAYDEWVLFEEAVVGREIEVSVLGNREPRASVAGEIIPGREFYDYEDKYVGDGAKLLVPAPLSDEEAAQVRGLALRVFRAVRAEGMARVDFFYEEKRADGSKGRGFLCNEINTIPGFTPISMYPKLWQATGLSYPALIDELISLALERHERRAKFRTTKR
ncbi:MAG: D-alanine--D-alanine ligase [Actinobacteria bacterium]|nr:D-alanine--D-alanine ligase [Actinomycetota bacterium]